MNKKNKTELFLTNKLKTNENNLLKLKSIKQNPITERLIERYTKNGSVDLQNLFSDLYNYVNTKDIDFKLKLIFKIYDSDSDGLITRMDLFSLLKSYSECKSDKVIADIVSYTFADIGLYKNTIDYNQFKEIIIKKSKNIEKLLL